MQQDINKIQNDFNKAQQRINKSILLPTECNEVERIFLKYIYAYMPISDIATYDAKLFLKIIRDTLKAKDMLSWGKKINGELFLNYVLSYRLNNEDIVDCREQFFNELYERIKNMSMKEAAIEVNYWCFEKATYQATNMRTISPLGIIKNAYGRCGEESAFLVAALRSVCIPARQCYTPRWAHCDDNHAWVEIWVDGKWSFLGACEPEPVVNKGWFTSPAQRGMLIHARVFSNIVSEPNITNQSPVMTQINILDNYTETKKLKIKVIDENNNAIEGAKVRFELINFAELFPLAMIKTDKNGVVEFNTGLGNLFIHISKESKLINFKVDMRKYNSEIIINWNKAVVCQTGNIELDMCAPEALAIKEPIVSQEMQLKHEHKIKQAIKIRKAYEQTFIRKDDAKLFAKSFNSNQDKIKKIIEYSNGNHKEIECFLRADDNLEQRVMLLNSLEKKDLSDITAVILEEHLKYSIPYKDEYPSDIYSKYLLCPRVRYEMITSYRKFLSEYFEEEKISEFRKDPIMIYDYINKNIIEHDELDYATISSSPKGLLNLKVGSKISKMILFVAICRTIGVPARISIIDLSLEFYKDNEWNVISQSKELEITRNCELTLHKQNESSILEYFKNYTIARLNNGIYNTLGFEDIPFDNTHITYKLQNGNYRIMTANRMSNGDILANIQFVKLSSGDKKDITVSLREKRETNEHTFTVNNIMLQTEDNSVKQLNEIVGDKTSFIAFLEEGKEPTEHLLNEMLEQQKEFIANKDKILFVLKNKKSIENPKLKKVYKKIGVKLAYIPKDTSFDNEVKALFDTLDISNKQLPLVMVIDKKRKCLFRTSGYNVGTGTMILKYLK